ncbi:MAG: rhodanese-like domain-containing protein [Chloroflexi bacterium]|nr:rhodanese-like domain-containing protein [Chloroflexota bacterium]
MKRLLLLVSLLAIVLSACAQGTPSAPVQSGEIKVDGGSFSRITAAQFDAMLQKKDFLLVNTHIPYAGEIKGTDLFMPYNEVEQNLTSLPADKGAKIVLYCRSGYMSDIAAKTLVRSGYTNVWDVEGGMMVWEREGHPLVQRTPAP